MCIFNLIEVAYNQPKLPDCAQWDPNGITFADETVVGREPLDIFVDRNNTVYAVNMEVSQVQIWSAGGIIPMTVTLDHLVDPWGFFVTINGDIYVGDNAKNKVKKWTPNEKNGIVVMNVSRACCGLFVDITNHLYCSLGAIHQIVRQSLDDSRNMPTIVAGISTQGSASNMLYEPRRIFVNINFDLYVADCFNHRVQLFKFGQPDGITVAGSTSTSSINLRYPTAVFFDADDYLFIVDNGNHRIVRSQSNELYCVVGCSDVVGSTSYQLYYPYAAAFDNYGNIFVTDQNNNRIQKFNLITNTFSK
jgi:hypothetical protein